MTGIITTVTVWYQRRCCLFFRPLFFKITSVMQSCCLWISVILICMTARDKKKILTTHHTHSIFICHYTAHNTGLIWACLSHAECRAAEVNHTLSPSMVKLILWGQKRFSCDMTVIWQVCGAGIKMHVFLRVYLNVEDLHLCHLVGKWCHTAHKKSLLKVVANKQKHPRFL